MARLFEPMTTEGDMQVEAFAQALGLEVRKSATGLYRIERTWCPVWLHHDAGTGMWKLDRYRLSNRVRRWKIEYRGKSLEKALTQAKGWLDADCNRGEGGA